MLRTARIGVLGALLVLAMAVPVMAEEETVGVTRVSLDRTATLTSGIVASIRLTGSIACDAAGPADLTTTIATQGAVEGRDNWDLYMFACTTEPRAFSVVVESLACDPDFAADQCFTAGVLRVEVVDANGQRITSARVVAQEQASPQDSDGGNDKANDKAKGKGKGKGNSDPKGPKGNQGSALPAQAPTAAVETPSEARVPLIGTLRLLSIWAARAI